MRGMTVGALAVAAALVTALPARAADEEAVNRAVEKGVKHLKASQVGGGWLHDQMGLTPLAALTLLECGVPADDDAIQKAAGLVRAGSPETDQTYSIALSVLFLDRLGEEVDRALIESLTVRLLGGQNRTGGWSYTCPKTGADEQRRLSNLVKQRNELVAGREPPRRVVGGAKRTVKEMPKEIQAQLAQVARVRAAGENNLGDNSNTQFAILALWVARRHGLPVDGALAEAEKRFRSSRHLNGGWGYMAPPGVAALEARGMVASGGDMSASPAMTCAGLLGLGLAYGAWNESALRTDPKGKDPSKPGPAGAAKAKDPAKDKDVVDGFRQLGAWVDAMAAANGGKPPRITIASGKFYYFLWSLERTCVAYGIDKVGRTDWYDWGVPILLANQGDDGGWDNGSFAHGPDTCFALLFLKRADLAQDLSRSLKTQMKDGLSSALRSGGRGGEDLVKGRKPFFDGPVAEGPKDKPGEGSGPAARLGAQLTRADGAKQEQALKELRDTKGAAYTQALAEAIPKLDGEALKKARAALAERMARMTSATLEVKLDDDDPEVRRAAALAVAMKEDKAHTYKLIELLDDREAAVTRAAHAALKSLSGEDFGPVKDASRRDKAKAVAAWKDWWAKRQNEKK